MALSKADMDALIPWLAECSGDPLTFVLEGFRGAKASWRSTTGRMRGRWEYLPTYAMAAHAGAGAAYRSSIRPRTASRRWLRVDYPVGAVHDGGHEGRCNSQHRKPVENENLGGAGKMASALYRFFAISVHGNRNILHGREARKDLAH